MNKNPQIKKENGMYLFLNPGETLGVWENYGFLSREISYYTKLKDTFPQIKWITYSKNSDSDLINKIDSINIISNDKDLSRPEYLKSVSNDIKNHASQNYILKTNQLGSAFEAFKINRISKIPLIIRCGNVRNYWLHRRGIISKIKTWLKLRLSIHYAKILIVPSLEEADYAKKLFLLPKSKVKILPNFVDTELFKPNTNLSSKYTLCFVGSFKPAKNLLNLISSMKNLDGFTLGLIGDGNQKNELENLAKSIGANVEFLGRQPHTNLPDLLNQSELFVFPSLYEGQPKAMLEAMSCGIPVITTPVYGIKNIVTHKFNGYICKDTTSKSIREGILEVTKDSQLREFMSINARKTIINNHSIESVLKKELSLYKELELI